jgi:DNA-binding response OmpR family regulator
MKPLRVLVCGGDSLTLQKLARKLSDEGVKVETSTRIIDRLCRPNQEWDLLLVDLMALTSYLRGLLPAIRLQFPNLNILGISDGTVPDISFLAYDLELDGYLLTLPKPEDLIVRIPGLAANYLCDTSTLSVFGTQPLAV